MKINDDALREKVEDKILDLLQDDNGWDNSGLRASEIIALVREHDTRYRRAAQINAELQFALEEQLEDGTPVIDLVFALHPDLRRRLHTVLFGPSDNEGSDEQ